jgi:autotransporter translocation and assembly factor TamB
MENKRDSGSGRPVSHDRGSRTPGKPVRKFWRILLKFFLYAAASMAVLSLGSFLILQNKTVQDRIKGHLIQAVENRYRVKLQVTKIGWNPLYRLSLKDLILSDESGLILRADSVSVDYLAPLLLVKTLFVSQLQVRGLLLNLQNRPDGTWNVSRLLRQESGQEKGGDFSSFDVLLRRIEVAGGEVVLNEMKDGRTVTREIKDIRAIAKLRLSSESVKSRQGVGAEIIDGAFRLSSPEFALSHLAGLISYDFETDRLRMTSLRIRTEASDLDLNGSLDLRSHALKVDARLGIKALSLEELGRVTSSDVFDGGTVSGSLLVRGNPAHIYHELFLRLPPAEVRSKGYVDGLNRNALGLSVTASIRNLNPAALPVKGLKKVPGDIHADMTLNAADLTAPTRKGEAHIILKPSRFQGVEVREGDVRLSVDRDVFALKEASLEGPQGRVSLKAVLTGFLNDEQKKRVTLDGILQGIDLARIVPKGAIRGKMNLDLKADVTLPPSRELDLDPAGMTAKVTARINPSQVNRIEIHQGQVNASWERGEVVIKTLDFLAESVRLSLTGSIHPSKRMVNLKGSVSLPDLGKAAEALFRVAPRLPRDLKPDGNLMIEGECKGSWNQPVVRAKVHGTGIRFKQVQAKTLDLTGTWEGLPADFKSKAVLDLRGLTIERNLFPTVQVKTHLTPARAWADLKIEHKGGEEAVLVGEVRNWSAQVKEITLKTLRITLSPQSPAERLARQLVNKGPVQLRLSRDSLEITSFRLFSDQAEISLAGRLAETGAQNLKLTLRGVNVERISWLWEGGDRLRGVVSADVDVSGTPRAPVINAHLSLKNGAVYGFPFSSLDVHTGYHETTATLRAGLFKQGRPVLKAEGEAGLSLSLMPFSFQPGALNFKVETGNLKLSELPMPRTPDVNLEGVLKAKAHVTGDFSAPLLEGDLSFSNGLITLKEPALSYKVVQAEFAFSREKLTVTQLLLRDRDEGTLGCTGHVELRGLKPETFDIHVTGKNFFIPFRQAIQARVTPDLLLSGKPDSPRLTGSLKIEESKIDLAHLSKQGPTEIRIVGKERTTGRVIDITASQSGATPFIDPMTAAVEVNIPKGSWIKGEGVNAEIRGQIALKKDSGKPFVLIGNLETVRGTYEFQSRLFKITQGSVQFIGLEEPNPNLDIQAETQIGQVKIIVKITGTAKQIKLSLDSDPQMTQTDIVSYLVFGKPANNLSAQQAFNAESAALSLSGQIAASKLKDILGDTLSLDTITIQSGGEKLSAGSVSLGKYVAPDLFMTYQQGFSSEGIRGLGLTYEFTPNFSVQSQFGNEQTTGIDLFWQFDF